MSALSSIGNFTLFRIKDTDLFVFKTASEDLQQERREGRIELVLSDLSYNILNQNCWITLNYQQQQIPAGRAGTRYPLSLNPAPQQLQQWSRSDFCWELWALKSNPGSRENPYDCLNRKLFTPVPQNVFAQRQLVIYLNVGRAERVQCRMLPARSQVLCSLSTRQPSEMKRVITASTCAVVKLYSRCMKDLFFSLVTHTNLQFLMPLVGKWQNLLWEMLHQVWWT